MKWAIDEHQSHEDPPRPLARPTLPQVGGCYESMFVKETQRTIASTSFTLPGESRA